jgi:hypothetical protein
MALKDSLRRRVEFPPALPNQAGVTYLVRGATEKQILRALHRSVEARAKPA